MGPIGVFDSGYGGLTILTELRDKLPHHDFLYLGDNARAPYGTRSFDVVYEFTLQAVEELFNRDCHLVILACNTASAKALRSIQQNDLPIIAPKKRVLGVIRPSTELVGSISTSKHIGILATPGTVLSNSYVIEIAKFSPEATVFQHACPMWVPLIENDEHHTETGHEFIRKDIDELMAQSPKIDTIVLGCTHYPMVKDYIESIVGPKVNVIAQGKIIAESLVDYLLRHPEIDERCSKNGKVAYLTSETSTEFDRKASVFVKGEVKSSHVSLQ